MMTKVKQALNIINEHDSGEISYHNMNDLLHEMNLTEIEIEKLNAELNKDVEPLDGDESSILHREALYLLIEKLINDFLSGKISIITLEEKIKNSYLRIAYIEFRKNHLDIAEKLDDAGINPLLHFMDEGSEDEEF
ncbi:MAG: hypothetical protein FWH29_05055 [Methanobrevibacter sp.]|nr:hypothetical protein [Methanobrevibacter sp.]